MSGFDLRDPGTFRMLWRFPSLLFPALIAVFVQITADTIFRDASAVAVGDAGARLFVRVLASVVVVALPAVVWTAAIVVTTVMAAGAWETRSANWQDAVAALRFRVLPHRTLLAILCAGYMIFLLLGVLLDHVADLLFVAMLYFFAFALPAHIIDERPLIPSLSAARDMGLREPIFVLSALAFPAGVVFVAALLGTISFSVDYFGPIAAGLISAFAVAFAITHLCGVYIDSVQHCEPQTAALGPPPPAAPTNSDIIDAEFIRTHFPPGP